jgi:hypothetical protein
MLDDPRLTGEARHDIDGQARLLARWLAQPSLEPPGEFRDSREAVVHVRRYARLLPGMASSHSGLPLPLR